MIERPGLLRERVPQVHERWDQLPLHRHARRDMNGRGDDVVRRLAEVDVVIGVHRPGDPDDLVGAASHDFVGIHVRRGARSRLIDVHDELAIQVADRYLLSRSSDGLSDLSFQVAEFPVGERRGLLE